LKKKGPCAQNVTAFYEHTLNTATKILSFGDTFQCAPCTDVYRADKFTKRNLLIALRDRSPCRKVFGCPCDMLGKR